MAEGQVEMKQSRSISLAANVTVVVLIASCVALTAFSIGFWSRSTGRALLLNSMPGSLLSRTSSGRTQQQLSTSMTETQTSGVLQALKREPHIVSACLYDVSGNLFAEYRRELSDVACSARLSQKKDAGGGYRSTMRPAMRQHRTGRNHLPHIGLARNSS